MEPLAFFIVLLIALSRIDRTGRKKLVIPEEYERCAPFHFLPASHLEQTRKGFTVHPNFLCNRLWCFPKKGDVTASYASSLLSVHEYLP